MMGNKAELTETEKLRILRESISLVIIRWFTLSRVVSELDHTNESIREFVNIGQDADDVLEDLFRLLKESGLLDEILRDCLARVVQSEYGAKDVKILW